MLEMWTVGSFNITSFTSSMKIVMITIPEEKRWKGVNYQDPASSEIPQEITLGINWVDEDDAQGLQVKFSKMSLARRVTFIQKLCKDKHT